MKFLNFAIHNFKGIKQTVVNLARYGNGKVYTFVGLNESGKTTILEALDWFGHSSSYDASALIPKGQEIAFTNQVQVQATLALTDRDKQELRKFLREKHGLHGIQLPESFTRTVRWVYKDSQRLAAQDVWNFSFTALSGQQRIPRKYSKIEHPAWNDAMILVRDELFPPIIYFEDLLFDFPERIYLDGPALESDEQLVDYREMLGDVMASIDRAFNIDDHLVSRYRSTDAAQNRLVYSLLTRLSTAITKVAIAEWRKIVQLTKDGAAFEIILGPMGHDADGCFVEINVKQGDNLFSLSERSLGFRWFLAFVLFTHFRSYRDDRRGVGVFLLDEPASNLHASAQQRLMQKFFELPNDQVMLFATHSHHLVNPHWLAGAFVVVNGAIQHAGIDANFAARDSDIEAISYFEYVGQASAQRDFYQPIMDALDFRPAALEKIADLVGVEGKNDFYTLLFMGRQLGLANLPTLYPGTGKGNLQSLLQLYLAWGRRCILLFDSDAESDAQRIRESLGVIANDRVFTLKDLDPAWDFALEGLFDPADCEAIIVAAFGLPAPTSFDKKKLNAAIQRLWIEGRNCSISSGANERFAKLLAKLSELLGAAGLHENKS